MKAKYPFKFLNSYDKEDAGIFFGRDEEINELYEMVFQSSVILVYGASGTGKTSLIDCGLAGKFQPHDWLALMVRRGANINDSLEKVLNSEGGEMSAVTTDTNYTDEWSDDSPTITKELSKIAQSIKAVYQKSFRPVYLIFDQFEELFILGTPAELDTFIETVHDILQSEQPVKIIFVIREEYLGYLFEFERAVPQLMRKKLRIEPMNFEKVKQVIIGASSYENSNVKLMLGEEDQLAKGIFDKIKGKGKSLTIQLPFLQVFLDKFYLKVTGDESRNAEAVFTMQVLNEMGEIGDVLINFLEEQVTSISKNLKSKFPDLTTEMTWRMLSPFATIEGTKEPISKQGLSERLTNVDPKLIDEIITAFTNSRILRYNEATDMFEIAHDALAKPISEKRSVEEKNLLEIKRLIKSQVAVKDEAREYFTEKQLIFIESYLNKIQISDEEKDWIAKSKAYNQNASEQELAKTRKRLRVVYSLLGGALIALIAAGYFGYNAKESEKATGVALAKSEKLINAFYFYDDKFALAFKDEQFYFIDKNGDRIKKLAEWKKAEQFNNNGFVKVVSLDNLNYLLDTSGVKYKVAYEIKDIDETIEAIDLTSKELNTIPDTIFNVTNLKVLLLSDNGFTSLPQKIKELKNLTRLDFSNNHLLDSLPKEIGELKNLTSLDLSNDLLYTLPKEIWELKKLTSLDLSNNQLDTLPKEIGELKNLTSLNLGYCQFLKSLPIEIGELKNLTGLDLSNNQFATLPIEIGQLKNLKILVVDGNQLTKFPEGIIELKNLSELSLVENQLNTLPKELGKLKNLTTLDLSGNKFTALPIEIGELKNLAALYLSGNKFTALPIEIGALKNLATLNLSNDSLTTLPKEIGELKNLTILNLSFNKLFTLPKEIGELKNLTTLNLSSDGLTSLPKEIGKLKNLTELDLSYNQFTTLPIEIGELKNLTTLNLSSNSLTSLPKEIGELKNLKSLDLSECDSLTSLPQEIGELINLKELNVSGTKISETELYEIRKKLPNCMVSSSESE